jgi:hypothetical protein
MALSKNDMEHIETQHTCIKCSYAGYRYPECRDYFNVMLGVIMLNFDMLNVVMLSVATLNVVAQVCSSFLVQTNGRGKTLKTLFLVIYNFL